MASSEETRALLEKRLAVLTARLEKIQGHLRDPGDPDSQEQVTERENDEILERLDEAEAQEVADIRTALARLEAGSYGECASCGEAIAPGRLDAVPYTSVCIGCAD